MGVTHNDYRGNVEGGEEFHELTTGNGDARISEIHVWTHEWPNEGVEVIKAIRVHWNDGSEMALGGTEDDPTAVASFDEDDRITKMSIFAGGWVDAIYVESDHHPDGRRLGGGGGDEHPQDIGNGVFRGFWGRSGAFIDALGTVFEVDD